MHSEAGVCENKTRPGWKILAQNYDLHEKQFQPYFKERRQHFSPCFCTMQEDRRLDLESALSVLLVFLLGLLPCLQPFCKTLGSFSFSDGRTPELLLQNFGNCCFFCFFFVKPELASLGLRRSTSNASCSGVE